MNDVIVEPIRQIRDELIERFGGIDGYFEHCRRQERASSRQRKPQRKQRRGQGRKSAKKSVS